MASQRLHQISGHLTAQPTSNSTAKHSDDIVIVSAVRTPLCRARKGALKDVLQEELLATVLKATLDRTGINPSLIEDVAVGNVLPSGGGATISRMAVLYAGLPEQTAVNTVNRQCSSGLQAVVQIATAIQAGLIEVGIGAGVESMTANYGAAAAVSNYSENIVDSCPAAADCLLPMGITSENVAKDFNVTRVKQDTFSAISHQRALAAQKAGLFDAEIVPVTVKTPEGNVTVTKDDGIRDGVTAESLAKLKPAFSETGTTTAGNASQITDGAAAVLLMKRKTAQKLGLPIVGKYVTSAVVGVPPRVMGIGPAFAIPAALKKAGITKDQVDVYEINEAFASQAVYCVEKLGLDPKKVNPKGGAIALGHPLGCTGARQIATILPELKRTGGKIGVTSMCIGTGMGMAAVFVSES